MKINVITGASGFVGKYLAKSLLASGEYVWVILRPLDRESTSDRASKVFGEYIHNYPKHFKVIHGNVLEENLGISSSILADLKGKQLYLWHLAANLSFAGEHKESVRFTNIVGTQNAVNFANSIAARYIHMSTAYVCGNTTMKFGEDDLDVGQKFRNSYECSKFEAEKYVRNHCSISHIIFRPSIILGDAYEGKAEGCTFGYYRFTFMFYVLKNLLLKTMSKDNFYSKMLTMVGTKYDEQKDIISVPWMVIPFPSAGAVDMVSVNYVVDSMLTVNNKIPLTDNITIHLVQKNKPKYDFLLQSLLMDLGFREAKLVRVPNVIFKLLFTLIYYTARSIRTYTKSISWYIPYFTHNHLFESTHNKEINLKDAPAISRDFVRKINTYAKNEIFKGINIKKFL